MEAEKLAVVGELTVDVALLAVPRTEGRATVVEERVAVDVAEEEVTVVVVAPVTNTPKVLGLDWTELEA